MKVLTVGILCLSSVVYAGSYDNNSFGMMPHKHIMKLNIESCANEAHAMGANVDEYIQKCYLVQKNAFNRLTMLYQKKNITAASWSSCVGQAKHGYSYDYPVMLACMQVIKDICPERTDGAWLNHNQCIKAIESGYWINNPKIYEPIEEEP